MGNTLGYADENCWENPSPLDRVQCASDDICLTEMKVEWFPKGEQIMSFERKCGKLPEDSGAFVCSVESDELYKKKHCVKKCSEEGSISLRSSYTINYRLLIDYGPWIVYGPWRQ